MSKFKIGDKVCDNDDKNETAKVIVEGVYGRLGVQRGVGSEAILNLTDRAGKQLGRGNFSIGEMKEIATHLIAIAEALEQDKC